MPRRVKVKLREDGILHIVYGVGADVTEEDAQEVLSWVASQCEQRSRPILADTSSIRSMCREARTIFADSDLPSAVAVVVKTPTARMIGNFFLGLNRTKVPMKLFNDDDLAFQWLREHL